MLIVLCLFQIKKIQRYVQRENPKEHFKASDDIVLRRPKEENENGDMEVVGKEEEYEEKPKEKKDKKEKKKRKKEKREKKKEKKREKREKRREKTKEIRRRYGS